MTDRGPVMLLLSPVWFKITDVSAKGYTNLPQGDSLMAVRLYFSFSRITAKFDS